VATEESDEMKKIRENVILLLMPVINPDGMDMWRTGTVAILVHRLRPPARRGFITIT